MTELYVKRQGRPDGDKTPRGESGVREIRGTKHTIIGRSGKFPRGFRSGDRSPPDCRGTRRQFYQIVYSIDRKNMSAIDGFSLFFLLDFCIDSFFLFSRKYFRGVVL